MRSRSPKLYRSGRDYLQSQSTPVNYLITLQ
jgi:hypothetical protein